MLLYEKDIPFDNKNYLYELKFDGFRATVHVSPTYLKIYSRNGTDLTKLYPELQSLKTITKENTIFDGEIIAFDEDKPSFHILGKRSRVKSSSQILKYSKDYPVVFIAFDCLYKGKNLIDKPLLERKKILETFKDTNQFIKTKYILENGTNLFKKVKKMNLEGIVAKKIDSIYTPDSRTKDWIKIKNYKTESFVIGGYVKTNCKYSLLLGEYRGKYLYYVGKVSVNKLPDFRQIKSSPFYNLNDEKIIYVKPSFKCAVSYIERTPNNNLREPVFKRMI